MLNRTIALAWTALLMANLGQVTCFLNVTPVSSRTTSLLQAHHPSQEETASQQVVSRRDLFLTSAVSSAVLATTLLGAAVPDAQARLESVNRPDLLPKEPNLNVIQTEKFLTSGQVKRMDQLLSALERDTGYRLRVLCQVSCYHNEGSEDVRWYWYMSDSVKLTEKLLALFLRQLFAFFFSQAYPNTPGLAIRDYWDLAKEGQKDDKYIVLVVDQFGGKGNVLNFNVGDGVKIALPNGTCRAGLIYTETM